MGRRNGRATSPAGPGIGRPPVATRNGSRPSSRGVSRLLVKAGSRRRGRPSPPEVGPGHAGATAGNRKRGRGGGRKAGEPITSYPPAGQVWPYRSRRRDSTPRRRDTRWPGRRKYSNRAARRVGRLATPVKRRVGFQTTLACKASRMEMRTTGYGRVSPAPLSSGRVSGPAVLKTAEVGEEWSDRPAGTGPWASTPCRSGDPPPCKREPL